MILPYDTVGHLPMQSLFTKTQNGVNKPAVSLEGAQHAEDGFFFGNVDAQGHIHFSDWGCHSEMASFSSPLIALIMNLEKGAKNGIFSGNSLLGVLSRLSFLHWRIRRLCQP